MDEARTPDRARIVRGHPQLAGRRRGEIGDGACVAERVRRLQVDEVGDREERPIDALAREHDGQRRLGVDHGIPGADRVESGQQAVAVGCDDCGELRIELLPAASLRELLRAVDAADAVCDLDELRQLGEPRRQRHRLALAVARPSSAVPLLVRRVDRLAHRLPQAELLRQQPGNGRVVGEHVVGRVAPRQRKLEPEAEAVERRVAGAEPAHRRGGHTEASGLVVVLDGLDGDVVAEPLRLLVGVRVTADVDQQRRVVDVGTRLVVEPDSLREPQRDQTLTEDVLHRLPEPEIDPERERRDQLGQADARPVHVAVVGATHRHRLTGRRTIFYRPHDLVTTPTVSARQGQTGGVLRPAPRAAAATAGTAPARARARSA